MKLVLNNPEQLQMIRSCEKSGHRYQVRIGDTLHKESIILTPEKLEMWHISQVSDLKKEDFVHFAKLDAEVLILGTGDTMVFPDPALTQALMEKGIGMEVMDTAAACRTYNVLLSDGRSVVAGLIL